MLFNIITYRYIIIIRRIKNNFVVNRFRSTSNYIIQYTDLKKPRLRYALTHCCLYMALTLRGRVLTCISPCSNILYTNMLVFSAWGVKGHGHSMLVFWCAEISLDCLNLYFGFKDFRWCPTFLGMVYWYIFLNCTHFLNKVVNLAPSLLVNDWAFWGWYDTVTYH